LVGLRDDDLGAAVASNKEGGDWRGAFADAIVTKALGIVVSVIMLVLLGVAETDSSWSVVVSQIALLSIPISIGASLASSQLGEEEEEPASDEPPKPQEEPTESGVKYDLKDLGLTAFGGVFLGFSVAPTEEILLIATQGHWWQALGTAFLSMALTYIALFEAQFIGQSKRLSSQGVFQDPWPETVVTYGVSLIIAAYLLWFLGFLHHVTAPDEALAMILVLALPVSLGGAVARMTL
jgi:putative integral membrane protein (TIGR02587 family)